ncbi:hypothetical protein [Pseudomonas entomophila]|uniref:hypothetical protein n=1 Tax=Pseudomonas entomophila TaxID=312306 RepID=UPI003EBDC8B9
MAMDRDRNGHYVTHDVQKFETEWEALNHEKKLRHEQYAFDAALDKHLSDRGLSKLTFAEWVICAPAAMMILAFVLTWNPWLFLCLIGWVVCGGVVLQRKKTA